MGEPNTYVYATQSKMDNPNTYIYSTQPNMAKPYPMFPTEYELGYIFYGLFFAGGVLASILVLAGMVLLFLVTCNEIFRQWAGGC
jgi:hypothetical protein